MLTSYLEATPIKVSTLPIIGKLENGFLDLLALLEMWLSPLTMQEFGQTQDILFKQQKNAHVSEHPSKHSSGSSFANSLVPRSQFSPSTQALIFRSISVPAPWNSNF